MDPATESRLKRTAARANRARSDPEAAIIEAFLSGAGQREIARAVDMSHPAVKYILDRHQNERDDVANEVQRRGTLRKGTTERQLPHQNAPFTPEGRRRLIERIIQDGRPISHVADEAGISRQRLTVWLRPMNWRRFGTVLWVVGILAAAYGAIEWNTRSNYNRIVAEGSNMFMTVDRPMGVYPAVAIIGGVMAVVGFAVMLSARNADRS